MAIKFNHFYDRFQMTFGEAYGKIGSFTGNTKEIRIVFNIYPNETARINDEEVILSSMTFTMPFSEITGELFPSMYQWILTQPGFENSISC